MESVSESLKRERARLEILRSHMFARVVQWLTAASPQSAVCSVEGLGGVGKTVLLRQMTKMATTEGIHSIWLDGRFGLDSPEGFLEALLAALSAPNRPAQLSQALDALHRQTQTGPLLICIDNIERVATTGDWLREVFFPSMPDCGILLAVASREGLSTDWYRDPALAKRIIRIPVGSFNLTEAREYVRRTGVIDAALSERLIARTAGHPLALAMACEYVQQEGTAIDEALARVTQQITSETIWSVVPPEQSALVDALTVLPEADQGLLSRVLAMPVSTHAYHAAALLPFVVPTSGGLSLHDTARAHLLHDMRVHNPALYRTLHQNSVRAIAAHIKDIDGEARRRLTVLFLTMCKEVLPSLLHPLPGDESQKFQVTLPPLEPVRPDDVPDIVDMLHTAVCDGCPEYFADGGDDRVRALAAGFPSAGRLIRGLDGKPAAFYFALKMDEESWEVLPESLRWALLRQSVLDVNALQRGDPKFPTTNIVVLVSVALDHPDFAAQDLHLALLLEGTAMSEEGCCNLFASVTPAQRAFLPAIGFTRMNASASGETEETVDLYMLDLRKRSVYDWMADLLAASAPDLVAGSRGGGWLSVDDLRYSLSHLRDGSEDVDTPLARVLGIRGEELLEHVLSILKADPPPPPLTRVQQQVLRSSFGPEATSGNAIAERAHMSRSNYYRHLRLALEALRVVLLDDTTLLPNRD